MQSWREWKDDSSLQQIISANLNSDPATLALQWSSRKNLPVQWLLQQIEGRQIAAKKLPAWADEQRVIFPPRITLEQCSSSLTADYKAATGLPYKRVADLTGGLGVDTLAFSKHAEEVLYIEPVEERLQIAAHNHAVLNAHNISYHTATAEGSFDELNSFQPDLIYLDPSRRTDQQKRFYRLQDLQPDVLALLPKLLALSSRVLIKAAPMLDIVQAIRELQNIQSIHVISTRNECRELLFMVTHEKCDDPLIHCAELSLGSQNLFDFKLSDERYLELKISKVQEYIYDPFAAISKAGAFKSIAHAFQVGQLNANTHLYSSAQVVEAFPGRIFEVREVFNYDLKMIKQLYRNKTAHLVFRNFPVDARNVIDKLKIKSGGDEYLFFITDHNQQPKVIACNVVMSPFQRG